MALAEEVLGSAQSDSSVLSETLGCMKDAFRSKRVAVDFGYFRICRGHSVKCPGQSGIFHC